MNSTQPTLTGVLSWPKRLLSADDLRRHLTSQGELALLPRTVITPLAADELRAKGIRITWQVPKPKESATAQAGSWSYVLEKSDAVIIAAVQAVQRDGFDLAALDIAGGPASWAKAVAETILRAGHRGGIVFCGDPALVACIANKISGMRAAQVGSVLQTARAQKILGANLFAFEMPGRTFFEIRQMLRIIVASDGKCPEEIAHTLKELDGHAHR
jgi:ribose 5-phosphate isomerase RpiB